MGKLIIYREKGLHDGEKGTLAVLGELGEKEGKGRESGKNKEMRERGKSGSMDWKAKNRSKWNRRMVETSRSRKGSEGDRKNLRQRKHGGRGIWGSRRLRVGESGKRGAARMEDNAKRERGRVSLEGRSKAREGQRHFISFHFIS